jgi:hypothetical protein
MTLVLAPDAVAASRPSAPRSVAAKPGNTTVRITWTPPLNAGSSPVDRYAVQRSVTSTGPWSTVATLPSTTFAWKNGGLVNGTRYYYRLRAHNAVGWSAASTVVSSVPRAVPTAPQSPSATWGDHTATVAWSAPASDGGAPVNGYRLQLSTGGPTWTNLPAGMQLQLTATGLSNGVTYHCRVQAHNAAGWGPASIEVYAAPGVPLPPDDLAAESTAQGILVSWTGDWYTSATPTDVYTVQVSTDGVNWSDFNSYNAGPTAYHFAEPYSTGTLGQTYYFRVEGDNENGTSAWSATASAVAGQPPGAVGNAQVQYWGSPFFWNVVTWSAPSSGSPQQGYYIDRVITEGPYQNVATLDSSKTAYSDFAVTHTTDYWYRITPYNQLGNGPSTIVHITTS